MGEEDLLRERHRARILAEACDHAEGDTLCVNCLAQVLSDQAVFAEDATCPLCQTLTSQFAGNPREWPVVLPNPEDPGKMAVHHMGCVADRVYPDGPTHSEVPA